MVALGPAKDGGVYIFYTHHALLNGRHQNTVRDKSWRYLGFMQ